MIRGVLQINVLGAHQWARTLIREAPTSSAERSAMLAEKAGA